MSEFEKLMESFGIAPESLAKVSGLEWRAQESSETKALFYKLPDESPQAIEAMRERLKKAKYALLFTNGSQTFGLRNCFPCGEKFFQVREELANKFYPIKNKKLIAVTGTNGKTTTVDLIRQILVKKGVEVMTIGTLGIYLNEEKLGDFGLTSPDYIDLRKYLFENDFQVCALEASSHAIHQKRLGNLKFSALGWTSFSQDHLDYHKNMDDYFEAKKALVAQGPGWFEVSFAAKSLARKLGSLARVSKENPAVPEPEFFKSEFNKINLEVALAVLKTSGFEVGLEDIKNLQAPPGRYNIIKDGERIFVVDFAHTPDALKNIGEELKKSYPGKSLVTVFGCGGDRDTTKRRPMGKAVSSFSDFAVVTSDNPRFEDPKKIIQDVLQGMEIPHKAIVDRKEAIKYARSYEKDSVILVAGKGHEPYIDAKGVKTPYSDTAAIREIIDD